MSIARYVLLIVLAVSFAGCQGMGSVKSFLSYGMHKSSNRENPQDESSDPWIHEAGTVARSEHPAEAVKDPLKLRPFFMSSKAMDIERNLGVGD